MGNIKWYPPTYIRTRQKAKIPIDQSVGNRTGKVRTYQSSKPRRKQQKRDFSDLEKITTLICFLKTKIPDNKERQNQNQGKKRKRLTQKDLKQ